jgi:hypothetical protein
MKILITFILLFVTQFGWAQAVLSSKEEVTKHADKTMNYFGDAMFEEAFSELRKYYFVSDLDFQNIKAKTIDNLSKAIENYGEITGEIFVKEENLKDVAIRKTYLLRYDTILLKFQIVYYKSTQGWIVNSFSWDDEFETLFE